MKKLLALCALFVTMPMFATTWYVNPATGGDRYDASNPNGIANGKGTSPCVGRTPNQACPFRDFRMLWVNPFSTNAPSWVISGGDTVIVSANCSSTSPCRSSGSDDTAHIGQFCWGTGPQCAPPDIPSGTSEAHTKILGENFASCSTPLPRKLKGPDPAKTSHLFANTGGGGYEGFNLVASQYVDIECIDLSGAGTLTSYGIHAGGTNGNGNILLQDVNIHGFQSRGIIGTVGGLWTTTRVEIAFNGQAGWDFDPGPHTASTGSVVATNLLVDWNGCREQNPHTTPIPVLSKSCIDDNIGGGYGDGIGTPVMTMDFSCDRCRFTYNTQDGPDLGHLVNSHVSITNSYFEGNMGGNLKAGPSASTTYINNLVVANCHRMSAPITGAPPDYNTNLSDFCRASGDANSANGLAGSPTVITIEHNTFVVYLGTNMDIQCEDSGSVVVSPSLCTRTTITYKNNVLVGYIRGAGSPAAAFGALAPTSEDYDLAYNLNANPEKGLHDLYTSPLLTDQPVSPITAESQLDNFNFTLSLSSPAKSSGAAIDGQTTY